MTDPHLFWTVFSAVLAAIILGGTFFWGLIGYSRHERAGTAGNRDSNMLALAAIIPLLVLLGAFYIAMGGR